MSREEAIEKLELMRQKVDGETYRALILAIKALEQEACEDCSDCVHIDESEPTIDNCACCTDMCNYQRKAPPVTPTQEPIFDNATNGDMIKAMFPDVIIEESIDTIHLKYKTINSDPLFFVQVSKKWWNAPYKKGGKVNE